MKKYTVRVTAQAQEHIYSYAAYIKTELCNPSAAEGFVRGLWKEIAALDTMPQRFPCLNGEPWETKGVRRMPFHGYLVYYFVDDEKAEVNVIGVILGRRDQLAQLEQLGSE